MEQTQIYVFQRNGLSSEEAVCRAVRLYLGDARAALAPIVRGKRGKPYFNAPDAPRFSVSHSGDYLVCAVSQGEVGVDLQQRVPMKNRVAERFFHPEELGYVQKGGEQAFFEVWTAKESYVKYTGSGFDAAFSAFSTVEDGRLRGRLGDAYLQHVFAAEGYCMCLCTSRPTLPQVIFVEE